MPYCQLIQHRFLGRPEGLSLSWLSKGKEGRQPVLEPFRHIVSLGSLGLPYGAVSWLS